MTNFVEQDALPDGLFLTESNTITRRVGGKFLWAPLQSFPILSGENTITIRVNHLLQSIDGKICISPLPTEQYESSQSIGITLQNTHPTATKNGSSFGPALSGWTDTRHDDVVDVRYSVENGTISARQNSRKEEDFIVVHENVVFESMPVYFVIGLYYDKASVTVVDVSSDVGLVKSAWKV